MAGIPVEPQFHVDIYAHPAVVLVAAVLPHAGAQRLGRGFAGGSTTRLTWLTLAVGARV